MQYYQRSWLLILAGCIFFTNLNGQVVTTAAPAEVNILKVYESQLTSGLKVRSMSDPEIKKYIARGNEGIATVTDFANEIKNLYPYESVDVAILFYFFNNDTLHRYFIVPGAIKEQLAIPITEQQLEQLNTDVYNTLNIYDQSASRAPRERGLQPVQEKSPQGMNFEKAVSNATKIFLPDSFTEQYKQLIVIPAFSIGSFPFQVLKPYKDNSFLIDKCSFTIVPSLIDFIAIRKRMLKMNQGVMNDKLTFSFSKPLFVCNPLFPKNTAYDFPALPGAKKEIENALPYSKAYILLEGKNATRKNVMDSIRSCDVAYFATHGIAATINPLDNNFLVLSGDKDPFLTSRDILSLRDSTLTENRTFPELVILSACQTGLGKSMQAGIFGGLARCFLIAGANQVIMSLWNVDDEATAYLMNRFVYYLNQPSYHLPSEPLRLAELDTKKKYPNPALWASFSVYGVSY